MRQRVARIEKLTPLLMLGVLVPLGQSAAANDACIDPYLNPVTIENCRSDPASWSTAWQVDRLQLTYDTRTLAGYGSRPSVNAGETIHFYVRAPAEFSIDFYRLGWYGGAGGRLMKVAAQLPKPHQPACEWQDGGTPEGYVTCRNWRRSYSLAVPQAWISGIYLAAIRSTLVPGDTKHSARTYAHDVLFVVREDQRRADFIYQQAVATEQAYNSYSYGPSLYNAQVIAGHTVPVAKASFERPFDALDNLQFYRFELPFVRWLEKNGYDVVYSTDIDTHEGQQRFNAQYKAFLTAGHSEYWTKQMYDRVQQARDDGLHLGFFSGNTLYWQMRLEEERAPPGDGTHASLDRVMVVYRHAGPRNALGLGDPNPDPALQTTNWRAFPVMRDEQTLVGVHFAHPGRCQENVAGWAGTGLPPEPGRAQTSPELRADPQSLTVADGDNWVYQGTGLHSGDEIPHVYGQEADSFERATPEAGCGRGPQEPPARAPAYRAGTFSVLASSAFSAAEVSATGVRLIPTKVPVNSVVYQACSGSWVFAAGDIMWADALGPALILGKDYSSTQIEQMTHNVLDVFAGRTAAPAVSSAACVPSFQPAAQTALSTLLDGD